MTPEQNRMLVSVAATAALFVVDCLTPIGITIGFLYILILVYAYRSSSRRFLVALAAVMAALNLIGWYLSPQQLIDATLINRLLAVSVIAVGAVTSLRLYDSDRRLNNRMHQQGLLAALGQQALSGVPLQELIVEANRSAVAGLKVDLAKTLKYVPEENCLILNWGCGWSEHLIGKYKAGIDRTSQEGYTMMTRQTTLTEDIDAETRFTMSPELRKYGVRSGIACLIEGKERPFGVIEVDSRLKNCFNEQDLNFLVAIANILSEAVRAQETEKEVAAKTAELEDKNRQLQSFTSVASHDLKAPLRRITLVAEKLESESKEAGSVQAARKIVDSANRMNHLIEDLLSYSWFAMTKRVFFELDLGKVLGEVVQDHEASIREKNARVVVDALPRLKADPLGMRQVFSNLIGNALKYSNPGSAPLIRVRSLRTAEAQEISVEDNGIGFDPKHADLIFKPFQRLHSEGYEGTGIGLAICQRIVQQHGGSIAVRSEPGKGSVFTVRLPASLSLN